MRHYTECLATYKAVGIGWSTGRITGVVCREVLCYVSGRGRNWREVEILDGCVGGQQRYAER